MTVDLGIVYKSVLHLGDDIRNVTFKKNQLTFDQFIFLENIKKLEKTSATELADAVHVTKSRVSKRLKEFEQDELIERSGYKKPDLRQIQIILTDRGKSMVEELESTYSQLSKLVTENYGEESLTQLFEMIDDLSEVIEKSCKSIDK